MAILPKLLIIDDLFGRNVPDGRNSDRENLCAHFLWRDATGDTAAKGSRQEVLKPVAEAVFCRAQFPLESMPGSLVENDIHGALRILRSGWSGEMRGGAPPWAMVLLDLCFYTGEVTDASHRRTPGMPEGRPEDDDPKHYFGLTLLDAIHREFPELPVVILSSKPREEVSLEFSQRGAVGFIARDDLRGPELLEEALFRHGLLPDASGEAIGNSLPVLLALREARRAARHGQNVLIRGERGTGKELLARYLNRTVSRSSRRPFVPVNSAILTPPMFASELFGIERKTATDVDAKVGLVETADGGDLFFDEIADMPAEVQAAVLRVLQERQITRVGGRESIPVDVRFISATNVDIELEERGFRADLLDRLCLGGSVWLPPLRERKSDIPLLVESFVRDAEKRGAGTMHREITADALDRLCGYDWPGNVRELQSCIHDAVNRHPDVEHLVPAHLRFGSDKRQFAERNISGASNTVPPRADLGCVLEALGRCNFAASDIGEWAGHLDHLQLEHTRLLARYLQAALDATKRRTPAAPQGQIQIHPAVKLITGDPTLTASRAADVVKRLLGPLVDELDGDLVEAYETALRLRPKSPRKSEALAGARR